MNNLKTSYPSPFFWVPTSYLAMGLIYSTLANVANIMFKNMGLDNAQAAFWSSLFVLPYVIKPLWAPTVELYRTKKFFVIAAQCTLVIAVSCAALVLGLPGKSFVLPVIVLFIIIGLVGATQDIASDGVYVTTLSPAEQAKFIGIQSLCWNGGPVIANGLLVHVSGVLYKSTGNWGQAWMIVLFMIAALIGFIALYHTKLLPPGAKALDAPKNFGDAAHTFGHTFATFFQKKDILLMIAFAFFFRFGYGFLDKMIPLFMIDAQARGGLGLTNESLGDIYGTLRHAGLHGRLDPGRIIRRQTRPPTDAFNPVFVHERSQCGLRLPEPDPDPKLSVDRVAGDGGEILLGFWCRRPDDLHDAADRPRAV